ncbi:MAG: DNA repair protein RadA [Clostridia bacterium]|nr:DNA repair protein RadA [Clostridia bacterium]
MAKSSKGLFFCKECGYESNGWLGCCPGCREWNTFVEAPPAPAVKKGGAGSTIAAAASAGLFPEDSEAVLLKNSAVEGEERIVTGIGELDRVLGGGLVKGSIVLVSGDPGIGKSTLMLMLSGCLAATRRVLYVSGEESCRQIKMRADRLEISSEGLYVLSETNVAKVYEQVGALKPDIMIVDSIQTMCDDNIQGAAGSVSQVREITSSLMKISKSRGITTFIVGHVTKDGSIAGPKILEHMVDTVLYFEGERQLVYRIMRCVKNRFGSTNEIGVFEMTGKGLNEVANPSATFLEGRPENVPGTAVACVLEGTRPMLVEVQALISGSNAANARRMSTGVDYNRLSMILAVLEKRLGLNLSGSDAYVNVVGGVKVDEPAVDLAVVAAIVSSVGNFPVPGDCAFFGEIGLTGEIRGVTHADKRLGEILRLGFKRCYMPRANKAAVADLIGKYNAEGGNADVRYIGNIKELRW